MSDLQQLDEIVPARIDELITDLAVGAQAWAVLPLTRRAELLAEVHETAEGVAEQWVRLACEIKGINFEDPYAGEEWISGPYAVLAGAGTLAHTLSALAQGKSPIGRDRLGQATGDRVVVNALPRSVQQWTLMHGFTAGVWLRPGISAEQAKARAGLGALDRTGVSAGVGVVLGAGNITSIAPLDVLYELVASNRSVILKLNPVLGRLEPVLSAALAPLIREGFVRIVTGGAEVGEYLTSHAGVSHVHITGSAATHDVIVWGTGEEAGRRRASGEPRLTVPITSELGGVSPVIVVPGRWSKADLRFQAEHVVTMRMHNSGHNCVAGQVVIVSSDWSQRDEFVAEVERVLAELRPRPVWYPRGEERLAQACDVYPSMQRVGPDGSRALIDLPAGEDATALEQTEFFAPVLGVVSVPGTGSEFLRAAVEHANEKLAGTLGVNVLIDPRTRRRVGEAFDDLIAELRYGTVAINTWTGLGFLTATASWGAYPGATIDDIQSGTGIVHNALLLDDVERTVVEGAFRPFPRSIAGGEFSLFPKAPWFSTARSAHTTGRLLAGYAAHPSWAKLPGIFLSAFRA
jgi:aldehyde dehydrogenase (NAD(P)+)